MNQMMYKKINVNKVLYKTFTTINFYSKSMRFLFKNDVKMSVRPAPPCGPPS